ncbi:MAG: redoxin family protein [Acidobacteria bacterium]|nr:redoxin family protein [Acidobacteriota bacterium]
MPRGSFTRIGWSALVLVAALAARLGASPQGHVFDLDGRAVDPLRDVTTVPATVLIFTATDCPISNRYAPELRRVHERFAERGVRFYLVYANPSDDAHAVRGHLKKFGYGIDAVRDPEHDLVRRARATVSPEAAVFDREGRAVYRGRIDDRFVEIGVARAAPTRHDLEDALTAILAGQPVATPETRAVGCFLADFRR